MSDMNSLPQNKPPFEHTELYANLVHAYYQRKARVEADAVIAVEFLDKHASDFREQRYAIYSAMGERIEVMVGEHHRQVDKLREEYKRDNH